MIAVMCYTVKHLQHHRNCFDLQCWLICVLTDEGWRDWTLVWAPVLYDVRATTTVLRIEYIEYHVMYRDKCQYDTCCLAAVCCRSRAV